MTDFGNLMCVHYNKYVHSENILNKITLTCSRHCIFVKYVISFPFILILPVPGDRTVTCPRADFRKHSEIKIK